MLETELFTIVPINGKFERYFQAISAFAYYPNKKINLITGVSTPVNISSWLDSLSEIKLCAPSEAKKITHLMYELGYVIESAQKLPDDSLLVVEIIYAQSKTYKELNDILRDTGYKKINLDLKKSPAFSSYKKSFDNGYENLKAGNCYQFNLTAPFYYSFSDELSYKNFILNLWENENDRGAFAHATYIPFWNKLYLSNSPECLFQIDGKGQKGSSRLWSSPIKGTVKLDKHDDLKSKWKELSSCKKNQSELYMITDLIRNDLSRIEKPVSKVIGKKLPLLVPGILHQYSLVAVELSKKVSLKDVVYSLFPGGSITGAPKKRVMGILKELETSPRQFYCGSTIIWSGEIKAASINIRSCEIDCNKKTLRYCAGGGITLNSEAQSEYDEMLAKVSSFIKLL